jgi:hypothetical protein
MAYKGRVTLEAIFSTLSQQLEEAKHTQNVRRLEELQEVVSVLSDIAAEWGDALTWEGGTLLPSQGRMTIGDFLCSLCEQIMALKGVPDKRHYQKLGETVHFLNSVAVHCKDNFLFYWWLDDLVYTLNQVYGAPFKMCAPTAQQIRATLAAAEEYQGVQARLIRRQRLRSPKAYHTYLWDDEHETVLEPEWVGIARANGPYTETIDSLLYKYDGTLLEFGVMPLITHYLYGNRETLDANRVLEEAMECTEKLYGTNPQDWELCQIEITDAEGRLPWFPAEKAE